MNTQEKREKIREIREKCHTDIFNLLCYCSCTDRKILKHPNVSRLHPAGKVVIVMPSQTDAEMLRDNCQEIVSRTNNDIILLLGGKQDPYFLVKYKITLHHAYDKILLSTSEAVTRKKLSGMEITEFFRNSSLNCNNVRMICQGRFSPSRTVFRTSSRMGFICSPNIPELVTA